MNTNTMNLPKDIYREHIWWRIFTGLLRRASLSLTNAISGGIAYKNIPLGNISDSDYRVGSFIKWLIDKGYEGLCFYYYGDIYVNLNGSRIVLTISVKGCSVMRCLSLHLVSDFNLWRPCELLAYAIEQSGLFRINTSRTSQIRL